MTDTVQVRPARDDDGAELARLDATAWTAASGFLSAVGSPDAPFFGPEGSGGDAAAYLVAEAGGRVVGYLHFKPPTPLAENAHVLGVNGLAVAVDARRRGVGTALLLAFERTARERGARKLSLRVLATNAPARRLYQSQEYVVEGTLRGEFLVDGTPVDDLVLARHLVDPRR